MATAETKENKTAKPPEARPAGTEFCEALARMLNTRIPIQIISVNDQNGDIVFNASFSELGITPELLSHPFCRTSSFSNLAGELLVRQNLSQFCDKVLGLKNYSCLVRAFCHRDFGLKIVQGSDRCLFQCHLSLVFRLVNESYEQMIATEIAKIPVPHANIGANKVERKKGQEKITILADDPGSYRIIVPKTDEIRVWLEHSIETVLEHFAVKNKDVSVTDNQFNIQFDITEKATQK